MIDAIDAKTAVITTAAAGGHERLDLDRLITHNMNSSAKNALAVAKTDSAIRQLTRVPVQLACGHHVPGRLTISSRANDTAATTVRIGRSRIDRDLSVSAPLRRLITSRRYGY